MKTSLFVLLIPAFFANCVPKADYEKLRANIDTLQLENHRLKLEIEKLRLEKKEQGKREFQASMSTEEDALRLLNDYYQFYNANFKFRKPRIRRKSNNIFLISLEECVKNIGTSDDEFFWNSKVITLTVNNDGSYMIR